MTPDDLDTLGKRLRFTRLRRGLSARGLSKAAGVRSESHVSLIEGGRNFNDLEVLRRLALALDVPMDWLVNGGDIPESLREVAPRVSTFRHQGPATGAAGAH